VAMSYVRVDVRAPAVSGSSIRAKARLQEEAGVNGMFTRRLPAPPRMGTPEVRCPAL